MFESLHFEPLQPALGGGHTFFFRDDDADHDLPELHRLLRLFGSRCVPLSLAVVPGTLTQSGARLLRSADSGTWLELHQHGWMHTNHETRGRKCEFGPERGYDEQRADIENGMRRLAEFLDERCAPIFTPPWNRCTTDTCHALAGLGFKAISRSRTAAAIDCSIKEVSIAVDIFRWKPERQLKTPGEIAAEIREWLGRGGPVGILLHHKVMSEEAFTLTEALVDTLRSHPDVRFSNLEALA